jgi:lipopolysaccharide transport system ATP-binding protein
MNMDAVKIEGLSKLYLLGAQRNDSLRDAVAAFFSGFGRKEEREFWALRDIDIDVKEGETLGLIGRNGAGKSTLLKILSRITQPTTGQVTMRGRVGSLLEVGTGFHGELSGRENIYLSGAVLGMSRAEINKAFDDIVEFSEIGEFLDIPVKRYSSGMYMRLAFAVAAHLEPEILIVDEVLAVGDAAFQRKCINKMRDVSTTGRTVIFVSHDMSAVTRICNRAVALSSGRIVLDGPATDVARDYMESDFGITAEADFSGRELPPGNEVAKLISVRVLGPDGRTLGSHDIRNEISIEACYEVLSGEPILTPSISLSRDGRNVAFTTQDLSEEWRRKPRNRGVYKSRLTIPGNYLSEGSHLVSFHLSSLIPTHRPHINERDVVGFDVTDKMEGDSARGDFAGPMEGVIRPILPWKTDFEG